MSNDHLIRILSAKETELKNELLLAAETGDFSQTKLILSNPAINIRHCTGMDTFTPLHHGKFCPSLGSLPVLPFKNKIK